MSRWLDDLAHAVLRRTAQVRYTPAEIRSTHLHADGVAARLAEWAGTGPRSLVSLGQNCSTSWYIKAAGAKQASYPFDWLAVSPALVEHVLDDDFRTFLDRARMIPLWTDAGHKDYHRSLFGHRDPRTFARDHAYYVRCVERFRELLCGNRPVLFITTVVNEHAKRKRLAGGFRPAFRLPRPQDPSHFAGVMDRLRARQPLARFLFIEQYTERPFHLELVHEDHRMAWVRHDARGRSTGARYVDLLDDAVMRRLLAAVVG